MNKLDTQYQNLLRDILKNGVKKNDRTGTGTLSVFGRQIRHDMKDGFPLLTTKKMAWKSIVTELLWFLRGDTNIKYLVDNDCHIWDGDAYNFYLKHYDALSKEQFIQRIKDDKFYIELNKDSGFYILGNLGPVYGNQWRNWDGKPEQITNYGGGEVNPYFCDCQELIEDGNSKVRKKNKGIDQIQNLINDLKTNPDSRRLMVNIWNVGEIDQMALPPCHYGFQVYTREMGIGELNILYNKRRGVSEIDTKYTLGTIVAKDPNIPRRAISLMWNQRSVDTFLGLPFNIASYGLLLEIIAKEVNMVPDELIGNLGDTHLYLNHIEQAKEQIGRELTWEERRDIAEKTMDEREFHGYQREDGLWVGFGHITPFTDWAIHSWMDRHNIPKRTREPYSLPRLKIEGNEPSIIEKPKYWKPEDFIIENYESHPSIKAPLSN